MDTLTIFGIVPNPYFLLRKEKCFMANRRRKIVLKCPVTEEERRLIELKMKQVHTNQIGAYLRKMAIDGFVIYTDTTNIKEMNWQLHKIGVNINQIAKKVNTTGAIYSDDIKELKERLEEIWQLQRTIVLSLR